MGDLHFFLTALNLSTLNAGILIMVQQVRLMMFSLSMVDYSMSFLSLWVVVAHKILVTSPEAKLLFPFLGLFGFLGFGLGLGLGLVNICQNSCFQIISGSSSLEDTLHLKHFL